MPWLTPQCAADMECMMERAPAQNLKRGIARDDELYAIKHAEHLARLRAADEAAAGTEPARAPTTQN